MEFHRWLLEGLALGAADPDAPLAMQLARDSVEVAGGFARVTDRAATEREGHEWADIRVEWTASDSTDCSAIVVFIDGIPTRVDGVPSGTRRRFR